MRFETAPGEQAQVGLGQFALHRGGREETSGLGVRADAGLLPSRLRGVGTPGGTPRLSSSATSMPSSTWGGVPRRCLYDNAKVITLGKDEEKRPIWNQRMLDFALRVGFEARLCRFYRPQTKGKVENGVKYVRRNMWPSIRFTDDADLNGSGAGVVRRGGQRPDPRDDQPGALGDAG